MKAITALISIEATFSRMIADLQGTERFITNELVLIMRM